MLLQLDSTTFIDTNEIVFMQHIINRDELMLGLRGGLSISLPYARRNLKKKGPRVKLSQNNGIRWRKGTAAKGPLHVIKL